MNKLKIVIIIIFLFSLNIHYSFPENQYYTFKIKYGIQIISNVKKFKSFSLFLPLPATTSFQKLVSYKSSPKPDKIIKSKKHDAKYLYFKIREKYLKHGKLKVLINAKLKKRARYVNVKKIHFFTYNKQSRLYRTYTKSNKYINSKKDLIKKLEKEIRGVSLYYKLHYLINRIDIIIKRKSRFKGLRTLNRILKSGSGECSDYTSIFVSVLRLNGIPSRHVVGRIITKTLKKSWHIWAEIFIPGYGWVSCDPFYYKYNKRLIGYEPADYIILHRGIKLPLPPGIERKTIPMLQSYYYFYTTYKKSAGIKIRYIWEIKKT